MPKHRGFDEGTEFPARRWLSSVKLERFKAAFEPAPIQLRPFNVVIGKNGSGKSTLLEALQWIATAIRRDTREASERYYGIQDLINLRARDLRYFRVTLTWTSDAQDEPQLRYRIQVEDRSDIPAIVVEELHTLDARGRAAQRFITTDRNGNRAVLTSRTQGAPALLARDPERPAIALLAGTEAGSRSAWVNYIDEFWDRAVFLRLSPNRLAEGSSGKRRAADPLLDEEGQQLPALLSELTRDQRAELVASVQDILPDIHGVSVSRASLGRDSRVNYTLLERMPYQGRAGRREFPIPAWMLSEGTRRITAILALISRRPPPTFLCVEEVENGLDPMTTLRVLGHLESSADDATQVVITTHSPWLLDHVPLDTIIQVRRIEGDTRYERFSDREEVRAFNQNVPGGTRYVNAL